MVLLGLGYWKVKSIPEEDSIKSFLFSRQLYGSLTSTWRRLPQKGREIVDFKWEEETLPEKKKKAKSMHMQNSRLFWEQGYTPINICWLLIKENFFQVSQLWENSAFSQLCMTVVSLKPMVKIKVRITFCQYVKSFSAFSTGILQV